MMKLKSLLSALILSAASISTTAQPMLRPYKSTVINPDGTVTFQYRNDKAKSVSVDVQFAGKNEMKKDAKTGLWTVTLGPAAPDMYPYSFQVDGISIMDPQCEQYFPNEGFKNSLLEIPDAKESLPHNIKNVPHGKMEYLTYYSNTLQYPNNAIVYLPPSYYNNPQKHYPVFYLISGTTDTEEVYYKVGRVNYILDNLLAEGKAKEMIVVLPYGNPNKLLPVAPKEAMPVDRFGADVFSNDLVNDLMPFIESRYRTINDRDHRAIGGFSRGGNQGLSNGLRNLDKFSYLCSYSSFTSMDLPVYDKPKETNKLLNLFWLGIGTDDFLYKSSHDYLEFLDKKGIHHCMEFTEGKFGHTWMNAKYFLAHTLPLLFNKEASAKAMKEGIMPMAPLKGDEKPFTPGVMARLFPKQIISPEYTANSVIFRCKAPEAKSVLLESELDPMPIAMQRDADGVWTAELKDRNGRTFKYCFNIDGMKVADPNNMYLSPDRGFKHSLTKPIYTTNIEMQRGTIQYNYADDTALYYSAGIPGMTTLFDGFTEEENYDEDADSVWIDSICEAAPLEYYLIPGKDDTAESWFKAGRAHDIADHLIAAGLIGPCYLIVTREVPQLPNVIRADDYSTWEDRSAALVALLTGKKAEPLLNPDLFRTTVEGKPVELYTITNGTVTAQITNYGAFLCSLSSPDMYGRRTNIITHYPTIQGYMNCNLSQVGPSLGRFANRIANASFTLDGKKYELTRNDGNNILHGGKQAFDKVVWDVVSHDERSITLSCLLPDGTDGFPGNLRTTLTYSISDMDGLVIHYEAETDKPTVVNLSNHAYFNLNGAGNGDIMNHYLCVDANEITETDRAGIPSGRILPVSDTPYDLRYPRRIGDRQMEMKGFQFGRPFDIPKGKVMMYDNNFCLTPIASSTLSLRGHQQGMRRAAVLFSPESDRTLEVLTDQPGLQVYTGARTAIALESQKWPDSPNHKNFPSTVLRPGEKYTHTMEYRLSIEYPEY